MATKKFSDPWLRGLKADAGERSEWYDEAETGLLVTVNAKRRVTFWLYARYPKGSDQAGPPSRRVLGDFAPSDAKDRVFVVKKGLEALSLEAARQKAREWKAAIALGDDPSRPPVDAEAEGAPTNEPESVANVFDEYYKRHVLKEGQKDGQGAPLAPLRSAGEIKRIFDHYILEDLQGGGQWRDRKIASILRRDVAELLDRIQDESGARQADAVLAQLSSMFNWHAARCDNFLSPIVRGMKRTQAIDRKRKRVLSDEEIRIMWQASSTQGTFGAFCQLLLLSAQRREKLRLMRRDHISSDGFWSIETEEREKGNADQISLPPLAMKIVNAQPTSESKPYIFQGRLSGPINGFSKDKAALDSAMEKIAGHPIPRWVLHDLRRTSKTLMVRAGVTPHITERVLGHAIPGVAGIYDQHDYIKERSNALKKLGTLVDSIIRSK